MNAPLVLLLLLPPLTEASSRGTVAPPRFSQELRVSVGRPIRHLDKDFKSSFYGEAFLHVAAGDAARASRTIAGAADDAPVRAVLDEALRAADGGSAAVPLEAFFPPDAARRVGLRPQTYEDSLNCFNTALCFFGLAERASYDLSADFDGILLRRFAPLPADATVGFGDLLVIRHPDDGRALHAAVHLDGGLLYQKASYGFATPPAFEPFADAVAFYAERAPGPRVDAYRARAPRPPPAGIPPAAQLEAKQIALAVHELAAHPLKRFFSGTRGRGLLRKTLLLHGDFPIAKLDISVWQRPWMSMGLPFAVEIREIAPYAPGARTPAPVRLRGFRVGAERLVDFLHRLADAGSADELPELRLED